MGPALLSLLLGLFLSLPLSAELEYGLFAKKEGAPITKFVLFSERCSGSFFVQSLVRTNFQIEESLFGHKHFNPWFELGPERYFGNPRHYNFEETDDYLFIVLFRDPYDWARSLSATPWHAAWHLHNIPFTTFIRSPWELISPDEDELIDQFSRYNPLLELNPVDGRPFKNIFKLREAKVLNLLKMRSRMKNFYYINYETVRDRPEEVVKEIERLFFLKTNPTFQPVNDYKGNQELGVYVEKKYSTISPDDLSHINSELNRELERYIGYSIITDPEQLEERPKSCVHKKSVCLSMVVRNDRQLITHCLDSLAPSVDYLVIVDAGSSDGTQKAVKEYMAAKGLLGELYEQTWVNYEHNRAVAVNLSKGSGDSVIFFDVDDYFLQVPKEPNKWQKDADLLQACLKENPKNSRYLFLLANCYATGGNLPEALKYFEKHIEACGQDAQDEQREDQRYWSLLQIGRLQEALQMPSEQIIKSYKRACSSPRPRAEPYYYLTRYYESLKDFNSAYQAAVIGLTIAQPTEPRFREDWIYDYALFLEYSVSSYWIGRFQECFDASQTLLQKSDLPQNVRECVEDNIAFAKAKLLSS